MGQDNNPGDSIRRTRRDARDAGDGQPVAYQTETGAEKTWTGDDDAPYTIALARASSTGVTTETSADDETQRLLVDEYGRIWARWVPGGGGPYLAYHDGAVVEQVVVSAVPSRVFQVRGILDAAITADRFMQIHDSAAAVLAGATPVWEALIPGSLTTALQYAEAGDDFEPIGGLVLANGLVLVLSTTPGFYTSPALDSVIFEATYEVT